MPNRSERTSGRQRVFREPRTRIVVADDYPPLLVAWRRLLQPLYDVVGEASDGRALLETAVALEPDVIVVDLTMPELNGLDGCRAIKRAISQTKIVLVTAAADPRVVQAAFHAGASAFVRKESAGDDLLTAIPIVLAGETYCSVFPGTRNAH
jgi:DNA-binding NarL/FixJ family response regulator